MCRRVRGWCLVVAMWAAPVWAQPGATLPPITWIAPEPCPNQAQITHQVERFLARPSDGSARPITSISGQVKRFQNQGFQVDIDFEGATGRRRRRLVHGNCARLSEAAALVMAMAIDPEHVRIDAATLPDGSSDPQPPATRAAPSPDAASASVPSRPQEKPAARARPDWRLGVAGILQSGVVPGLGTAVGSELSIAPHATWRLGVVGTYGFAHTTALASAGGAEARFSSWSVGARTCWQHARVLQVAACATAEYFRIRGEGLNVEDAQSSSDGFGALWVGLQGGYNLTSGLSFALAADAGRSLSQPAFSMQGVGEIYRPGPWLLRGAAIWAITWR
jgi:hypothetical protein